jgi:hypothetical protein
VGSGGEGVNGFSGLPFRQGRGVKQQKKKKKKEEIFRLF